MSELSVRPGGARPETVLVSELLGGGLYVQGWPDGPAALLLAEDAESLRTALDCAFGAESVNGTARAQPT